MNLYQTGFDATRKPGAPWTSRQGTIGGMLSVVGNSSETGIGFFQTDSSKLSFTQLNQ